MWGPETRCPSTYEIIVTKVFRIGYVLSSDYSMEVARLLLVKKRPVFSVLMRDNVHIDTGMILKFIISLYSQK